jgi:hypothetical protein
MPTCGWASAKWSWSLLLGKAGFGNVHTAVVHKETEAPFFQTVLATGNKGLSNGCSQFRKTTTKDGAFRFCGNCDLSHGS